jgi:transcriptional regulator with XRE-family HTH domain
MIRLRVREVAEQQGIRDVTDLAARSGIAYATAYRLWKGDIGGTERGERSVGIMTLHRVAMALQVPMSELYEEIL